jgi:G:T-mismatch repair DNA endonuclease (very short patch repair protein)
MRTLRKGRWQIVRIWECHLGDRYSARVATRISRALQSRN